MVVGGIPTLGDINWAQVAQAKQSKFTSEYISTIADKAYSVAPQLSYDGKNVNFTPPAERPLNQTELWNNYKVAAESSGIRPDFDLFKQEIFPRYRNLSMESFNNQLVNLAQQKVPPKKLQNLYKISPEFRGLLDLTTGSMSADNPYAPIFQTYKPQQEQPGLMAGVMENPLPYAIGGAAAFKGSKAILDYMKTFEQGGKIARSLRGIAPAVGGMALSPLAKFAGATEEEADIAKNIGMVGAGGVYGARGVQNLRKNRLMTGLASDNLTKKEILNTAKKLGIKDVSKNTSKQAARQLVENKIKGQSVKATTKAVGQSAIKKALAKFAIGVGSKQLAGSALPVVGNIAAAGASIYDLWQLGQALFGKEEEQATPTNEIGVPTNTDY